MVEEKTYNLLKSEGASEFISEIIEEDIESLRVIINFVDEVGEDIDELEQRDVEELLTACEFVAYFENKPSSDFQKLIENDDELKEWFEDFKEDYNQNDFLPKVISTINFIIEKDNELKDIMKKSGSYNLLEEYLTELKYRIE